jgi:hypothetical protein
MRADPRGVDVDRWRQIRVWPKEPLGCRLLDDALRSGIGTVGSEPGVSLGRWGSVDTVGWLACVAIAAL